MVGHFTHPAGAQPVPARSGSDRPQLLEPASVVSGSQRCARGPGARHRQTPGCTMPAGQRRPQCQPSL